MKDYRYQVQYKGLHQICGTYDCYNHLTHTTNLRNNISLDVVTNKEDISLINNDSPIHERDQIKSSPLQGYLKENQKEYAKVNYYSHGTSKILNPSHAKENPSHANMLLVKNAKIIPPKHSRSVPNIVLNTKPPPSINLDLNTQPPNNTDLGSNIQSTINPNLKHSSHAPMQDDNVDIGMDLGLDVP
ncbi:hypothetical protein GmHk_03G006312 [Glycine max]|nr:hypothetical protein GmHk_03G006312 [Glycine max]